MVRLLYLEPEFKIQNSSRGSIFLSRLLIPGFELRFSGFGKLCLGVWVVLWSGCGPAIPLQETPKVSVFTDRASPGVHTPQPWEIPGQSLGLRLLSANERAHLSSGLVRPQPNLNLSEGTVIENPVRTNSNQIYFTRIIRLVETELFLVWNDGALEVPILYGSATHQVLSGNNQLVSGQHFVPVLHDPDQHFWFIRVADLFLESSAYSRSQVSEADTQAISLQLVLANNSVASIEVQFRASGPSR